MAWRGRKQDSGEDIAILPGNPCSDRGFGRFSTASTPTPDGYQATPPLVLWQQLKSLGVRRNSPVEERHGRHPFFYSGKDSWRCSCLFFQRLKSHTSDMHRDTYQGFNTICTRRFISRPGRLSLDATGSSGPSPKSSMRAGSTPLLIR